MENSQLIKKTASGYNKVYPLAYIQGIIDAESKEKLSDILLRYNHIYVPWQGSQETTRLYVPKLIRRHGLWISYDYGNSIRTEYFTQSNTDALLNIQWANSDNWEEIPNKEYINDAAQRIPEGSILPSQLSPTLQELIKEHHTITNFPDDEDLTQVEQVLRFKDRDYGIVSPTSRGYKILRRNFLNGKNILEQSMINTPNTIYEIRYGFDLNKTTINIPNNCVLLYNGGTLTNGTIVGDNTSYIKDFKYESNLIVDKIKVFNKDSDIDLLVKYLGFISFDRSVNVSSRVEINANKFGKILSLDFSNFKFSIQNGVFNNGMIRFSGFDYLEITGLNMEGDSILDNNRQVINTDINYYFLYIDSCKTVIFKNNTIKNVRGTGVVFTGCENVLVDNSIIEKTTYNCIIASHVNTIHILNSNFTGVGDRGDLNKNLNLGAGITTTNSLEVCIMNCTITNVADTGIQVNGTDYGYIINCCVDGFGKDGMKIIRSNTFYSDGINKYGIIQGNVIKNKFEGKYDGSAYIIISNTINGIISNNTTIKGNNIKDDYNVAWGSIICNFIQPDIEDELSLNINNNITHNNIKVYNYENINIHDNYCKTCIYCPTSSVSGARNYARVINVKNNTIQADEGKTLMASISIYMPVEVINVNSNTCINKNGEFLYLADLRSSTKVYVGNNSFECKSAMIDATVTSGNTVEKFVVSNNYGECMDVAIGVRAPIIIKTGNVGYMVGYNNHFKTIYTPIEDMWGFLSGGSATEEICYTNYANGSIIKVNPDGTLVSKVLFV